MRTVAFEMVVSPAACCDVLHDVTQRDSDACP